MKLADTVEMMNSADYVDRFRAEYYQLAIRFNKLCKMLNDWDDCVLEFKPASPKRIYNMQADAMADYLDALKEIAIVENISLDEID